MVALDDLDSVVAEFRDYAPSDKFVRRSAEVVQGFGDAFVALYPTDGYLFAGTGRDEHLQERPDPEIAALKRDKADILQPPVLQVACQDVGRTAITDLTVRLPMR